MPCPAKNDGGSILETEARWHRSSVRGIRSANGLSRLDHRGRSGAHGRRAHAQGSGAIQSSPSLSMPLPLVVVEVSVQDRGSREAAALIEACTAALSGGRCTLTQTRNTESVSAVAIVSFRDG